MNLRGHMPRAAAIRATCGSCPSHATFTNCQAASFAARPAASPSCSHRHLFPSWLSNRNKVPLWTDVYESRYIWLGLGRLLQSLRQPFRIEGGNVTNKERTPAQRNLNVELRWPLLALVAVYALLTLLGEELSDRLRRRLLQRA